LEAAGLEAMFEEVRGEAAAQTLVEAPAVAPLPFGAELPSVEAVATAASYTATIAQPRRRRRQVAVAKRGPRAVRPRYSLPEQTAEPDAADDEAAALQQVLIQANHANAVAA